MKLKNNKHVEIKEIVLLNGTKELTKKEFYSRNPGIIYLDNLTGKLIFKENN